MPTGRAFSCRPFQGPRYVLTKGPTGLGCPPRIIRPWPRLGSKDGTSLTGNPKKTPRIKIATAIRRMRQICPLYAVKSSYNKSKALRKGRFSGQPRLGARVGRAGPAVDSITSHRTESHLQGRWPYQKPQGAKASRNAVCIREGAPRPDSTRSSNGKFGGMGCGLWSQLKRMSVCTTR
jgi:hypothetical protein